MWWARKRRGASVVAVLVAAETVAADCSDFFMPQWMRVYSLPAIVGSFAWTRPVCAGALMSTLRMDVQRARVRKGKGLRNAGVHRRDVI